jgi:hypothetical protein
LFDKFREDHILKIKKYSIKWADLRSSKWFMDGRMDVKAVLKIAQSAKNC